MPVGAAEHVDAVGTAAAVLGDLAERDVALGALTTYRVGGSADLFVKLRTVDDLTVVVEAKEASGLPVLVVGRGSNLLVADTGFRGIAVSAADMDGADSIAIDQETATVVAGAAVSLPVLARRTAAAALTGFEWAVGIPGSIGGAVRMNAGGHGSDMAASLHVATVADLGADPRDRPGSTIIAAAGAARATPGTTQMTTEQLDLRFRSSGLRDHHLVIDATLRLAPGDRVISEREVSEIVQWRRVNQPGGQNAGSVFVNPVPGQVTCGALIEAAGLRGHRHGSATVSDKHANFIQADDGGSADDVRQLMSLVRDRVEQNSGYRLRSEIRLVGFGDEL